MLTNLTAGTSALSVATLVLTDQIKIWHVMFFAFLLGMGNAIDAPVRQSFNVEVVGKEDLPNAVGLNSANFNTGPLGNAFLVVVLLMTPAHFLVRSGFSSEGAKSHFFLSSVLFLLSIILAFRFTVAFGIAVSFYAIMSWLTGKYEAMILRGILLGFLPVLLIYLGLNGYEISSVLQMKLLVLAAIWAIWFFRTNGRPNQTEASWIHGMTFHLLTVAVFLTALFFFVQTSFGAIFANRLGIFLLVPVAILLIWAFQVFRGKSTADSTTWNGWWRVLAMLGLTGYFFWLFVAYTNVLQVFS